MLSHSLAVHAPSPIPRLVTPAALHLHMVVVSTSLLSHLFLPHTHSVPSPILVTLPPLLVRRYSSNQPHSTMLSLPITLSSSPVMLTWLDRRVVESRMAHPTRLRICSGGQHGIVWSGSVRVRWRVDTPLPSTLHLWECLTRQDVEVKSSRVRHSAVHSAAPHSLTRLPSFSEEGLHTTLS